MDITFMDKIGALNQISQRKLVDLLDKIPSPKDLVIEPSIIKPLEHISGVSLLKRQGVEKIFKLGTTNIKFPSANVVFLVYNSLISVKHVCDFVNEDILAEGESKVYHCVLMSRQNGSLKHLIEEEGLHGKIILYTYQWELIPLDTNVISLENNSIYKSLFVDGDQASIITIAKSIWTLKLLLGNPVMTICIGENSNIVDKFLDFYSENFYSPPKNGVSDISCFIIFDRNIDYVSTLLHGCTYTSLMDEVYRVSSGFLEMPEQKSNPYSLVSQDDIYYHIKNFHFSSVIEFLRIKTKELSNEFQKSKTMELAEMKVYIKQSLESTNRTKKSLECHIDVSEKIKNKISHSFETLSTIENCILEGSNKKECLAMIGDALVTNRLDKWSLFRLVSLLSITNGGLYSSEIQTIKTQVLNNYGYQMLPIFCNLKKDSLITEQTTVLPTSNAIANKVAQAVRRSGTWMVNANRFNQFPDKEVDIKNPDNPSYVFNGAYIPLISSVITLLYKNEFSSTKAFLPHTTIKSNENDFSPRSFLVYFVGGVTYSEIASLQLLEKLLDLKILIAATSIINGKKIMESFV